MKTEILRELTKENYRQCKAEDHDEQANKSDIVETKRKHKSYSTGERTIKPSYRNERKINKHKPGHRKMQNTQKIIRG